MGLLSQEISRAELKPGDHIYSWRTSYIYAHHGIYVGEGNVIQFTNKAGAGSGTPIDSAISSSPASAATGNPCPRCGYHSGLSGVISSCVDCFVADGHLCLFEYDVSIPYFLAKVRGGTCTIASSDSPAVVLERAGDLLKKGFGVYGLFRKNCEDFAIYCKTGKFLNGDRFGNRIGQTVALSCVTLFAFGLVSLPFSIPCSRLINEFSHVNSEKITVEKLVSRHLTG
ncbi:hypothetical protein SLEP1_g12991 [Rubroshorea leprosula]|uniref:LRAT domain-containing protein n=1 Tax=Rubroshorea leprosula TaxID=152421 RepID=A0AAV5IK40_9ROSI|nr:hypothetical protein SLEP1_g12991 [Rubroshorea leprosula]